MRGTKAILKKRMEKSEKKRGVSPVKIPNTSSIFEAFRTSVKDGDKLRAAKVSKESHITDTPKQLRKIAAARELKKRGDPTLLKTSFSPLNWQLAL